MNILYRIIKGAILSIFTILSFFILYYFFYIDQQYRWDSIEVSVNWMVTILFFIVYFYILFLLIDFKLFNYVFFFIIIVGAPAWIILYLLEFFKIKLYFWNWVAIMDVTSIMSIAILAPGLSLNFIKYIRNNSDATKKRKIFQNYHIHEGFIGILFVIIACCLWIIRYLLIQHKVMKTQLRIFLAFDMILLFLFLFSGSFLIFRDRYDILELKFIEKRSYEAKNQISAVFNPITADSIRFFKSPKIAIYPFGILLSSFSINFFIYGTFFLPEVIFRLNHEIIVFLGFILCFIAGGMIGIDWYRFFAKIYPDLYQEIDQIINNLKINS